MPKAISLTEAIEHYLDTLRATGRVQSTLVGQRLILSHLITCFGDMPIRGFTEKNALHWMTWLGQQPGKQRRPYGSAYVDQHRVIARALFAWAVRREYIRTSPFAEVRSYRKAQKEIQVFTPQEVERLLATQDCTTPIGHQRWTIMAILLDTGLRISELTGLRICDLDGDGLHALGKGNRERTVPLSAPGRELLEDYLSRLRRGALPLEPIFTRLTGRSIGAPINKPRINHWMKLAGRKADVRKRCSPHSWRHTFATMYLRAGGDPLRLQRILGHSKLDMTNRYCHVAFSDVARNFDSLSPFAALSLSGPGPERPRPTLRVIPGGRSGWAAAG